MWSWNDAEDVKSLFKDELKWRGVNTKRKFPLSSPQKEMCCSAPQPEGSISGSGGYQIR